MATDWIKWTKGLTRKREVLAIADRLGVSNREAAAMCMEVWEWADDNVTLASRLRNEDVTPVSRSCHAPSVTKKCLDVVIGVTGFAEVMAEVGWLESSDAGISFPNFERHNSQTAKSRALASIRQKAKRANCHADVTLMSRSERDKSVTRSRSRIRSVDSDQFDQMEVDSEEDLGRTVEELLREARLRKPDLFDWRVAWLVEAGRLPRAVANDKYRGVRLVDPKPKNLRGYIRRSLQNAVPEFENMLRRVPKRCWPKLPGTRLPISAKLQPIPGENE